VVRGTFSPVRAWRPTVGPASPPTLGLMEASIFSGILLHPVALGCLGLLVLGAVVVAADKAPESARFSAGRLLLAFSLLVVAALLIAAVSAYVPPQEAAAFGVRPENYHSALIHQFVVTATFGVYAAILGCVFVGLPITLQLAALGFGTIPLVVLASLAISVAVTIAFGLVSNVQLKHAAEAGAQFAAAHAALALAFGVGLGLPWRRTRSVANEA